MYIYDSCHKAIQSCLMTKTFSVAHLYNMEKTMDMHIHDCCEIYYSISGGKQFLINNHLYSFQPGDIFFIDQCESHHIAQIDDEIHERYVLNIHPEYLRHFSNARTNLGQCFDAASHPSGHRLSLSLQEQQRFLYLIHKLASTTAEFGQELLEQASFLELMVFFNELFLSKRHQSSEKPEFSGKYYEKTADILTYINQNLANNLNIAALSEHFSLSASYLSMIFKKETGTTIQKYITGQRIALAKKLLSEGHSVTDTFTLCGFGDYSNFLKTFTRTVGISPKKFSQFSLE